MNTKMVYSTKIAAKLCEQGYKIIKTVPNPAKPWLISYLFESTPELLEALDKEIERSREYD